MGMRVSTEEFCQPPTPNAVNDAVADFQRGRVAGFQWRSSKDLSEYERMWYLPTERDYRCVHRSLVHDEYLRIPRTYRTGSQPWIDKQAGVTHRCTDTYIHHIQRVEDIERAHGWADRRRGDSTTIEEFLKEREGLQIKTLGGW
jgi:hypothetical protein